MPLTFRLESGIMLVYHLTFLEDYEMHVIKLCRGMGNGVNKACLLAAANIARGCGYQLDCNDTVDLLLRGFIPNTNDNMSDEIRSEVYSPFIWEINGTFNDDPIILRKRYDKMREMVESIVEKYLVVKNSYIDILFKNADLSFKEKYYRSSGGYLGQVLTNVELQTSNVDMYRECGKIIEEVIKFGDKRPVERVVNEDELAEKLGVLN